MTETTRRRSEKRWVAVAVLVLAGLVVLGVFADAALRRLSQESLAILAAVMVAVCIGGLVVLPLGTVLVLALVWLWRQRSGSRYPPSQTVQPPVVVVQSPAQVLPPTITSQVTQATQPRQFLIVGEEE